MEDTKFNIKYHQQTSDIKKSFTTIINKIKNRKKPKAIKNIIPIN